ncbi:hypothetical protein NIIDMKKI_30850 [Mycobacterium kansasii]|uniref:Membrane transport protein MMPL domain-containing protein n=1 Tax=Mycobacterium kansasii TaxID=1768 RepID=A0A7G1IE90_MYCKA|nr:hypothetical protein NIIDMKKI_30850 [Mycobacterium kansasii]
MNAHDDTRPRFMRAVRTFAVPIIVAWLLLTIAVNVLVPWIEFVARSHAVTMSPQDAPAMIAAKHMGKKFQEFDSDSIVMLVLESDKPLGEEAHRYYDGLVKKLQADHKHVQHLQDLWGDPVTAAGAQSTDGKAAYAQINTAGDQGSTLGNESVDAVRKIVDDSHPPAGIKAYVTGPAALTTDMNEAADKSMFKMMGVTGVVIMIMLAIVYRSVSTVLLVLFMVFLEMLTARESLPSSATRTCWAFRRSWSPCCRPWPLRREQITRYSSSGVIRRRVRPARIGKPPTTRCSAAPITSSWARG